MRIVADTNRIIAALIKDSVSRKILFAGNFEFICPDHAVAEIYKYEEEIRRKANISHDEFEILFSLLFEFVEIIPKAEYADSLEEAKNLIKDMGDVPFMAVCLALKADGIWSDDPHFLIQDKVRIFKTKDMMELIRRA